MLEWIKSKIDVSWKQPNTIEVNVSNVPNCRGGWDHALHSSQGGAGQPGGGQVDGHGEPMHKGIWMNPLSKVIKFDNSDN